MAQTPRCPLDGGPYKPPLGVRAIYSQSTVSVSTFLKANPTVFSAFPTGRLSAEADEVTCDRYKVHVLSTPHETPLNLRCNTNSLPLVFPTCGSYLCGSVGFQRSMQGDMEYMECLGKWLAALEALLQNLAWNIILITSFFHVTLLESVFVSFCRPKQVKISSLVTLKSGI